MPEAAELGTIRLQREQLSKQVAQQIQDNITEGKLKSGDRLPSERELAEQLQVSRTVVREAVKLLEDRGLISVNVGSGSYVVEMPPKAVSRSISLYVQQRQLSYAHLAAVRRMIEVEIAEMAARNATPEDIKGLEQAVHDAEEHLELT
ncbi:MAG: GntR family transcriptional regulator [Deltaproteobacteria bacterium]|nr:GntR family transcriptional regulator [Deltaproteobacteria bacterium]